MDPLTALGTLAGAIQLLDTSLKYSCRVCSFMSDLKHAKENVRSLHRSKSSARGGDLLSLSSLTCPD